MKSKTTKENVTESHDETGGNTRYMAAVDALVGGASVAEAARQSGYARETLSRLKHHNLIFKAALNQRRAEARDEVTANLRGLISEVITSIRSALQNPELSPGVILQAGLTALPKLYAIVAENETGIIDPRNLASDMASSAANSLILELSGVSEAEIEKLLRQSEAELRVS